MLARLLFFIWASTQVPGLLIGQETVDLTVVATDFEWRSSLPEFEDTAAVSTYLTDWVDRSRERAYWEASVDSLVATAPGRWRAVLHRGPAYGWAELRPPTDERAREWARRAGYRPRRFAGGRPLRQWGWEAVRDSLVVAAANAGYPFVEVGLDSIRWQQPGQLTARIAVDPGPLVTLAELRVPETVRVRPAFLQRYLGLYPEQPYRERSIRRLRSRINQLPYLGLEGSPTVTFRDSLAFIDLPLRKRSASRFDFVIGVLPNAANDGKLRLTGELNGELYNGFGQGERIAARFEQLQPQTQELALGVEYPFLFGLPFGFEGSLDLYRRDSSFLNLDYKVAAAYLREGNDRLSVFLNQRVTIVPGLDSTSLVNGRLPDTLGVKRSFFGLQFRRTRTDRRFSPRNGYTLDFSGAAGFRRLRNLEFAGEVADSLTARSSQFELTGSGELFLDPLPGTVLYFRLAAAAIVADQTLLANEQYRIGGARLLRGFNEQLFFATNYAVGTAEFRLLLGERAFLYAFGDFARVDPRNRSRPDRPIDYPIGFGAGVNFDTRAGIFGLSLALGRRNGVPLDPGAPKVHLGYVSIF